MRRKPWLWALAFLGWVVVGLCFGLNDYLFADELKKYYSEALSLPSMLLWELAYWPVWAALTPLIFLLARRFPVEGSKQHLNLLINIAVAARVNARIQKTGPGVSVSSRAV